MSQIRYSSEKGYLEDVHGALEALEREGRRIPLTQTLVGQDFFNLSCSGQTKQIYDLAKRVDPQSASITDRKRTCDDYVARQPEPDDKQSVAKRKVPRSLYGKEGKSPKIFIYEHSSGLLLLTSNAKDVGDDYVLINYEPIKKIKRETVVKKVKGEPQTEDFDLEEIIKIYARQYGVSSALVKAVIKAESDYNPYAVSSAGARGLMQLMPSTALEMQVEDIFDPIQNIGGGVQYLSRMLELFNGDIELSLAAYNAGPGAVLRCGGIPPYKETKNYVPKVLKYYEKYKYDSKPVRLTVALNKKPAMDYLPEIEVEEQEEIETRVVVSYPMAPKPSASGNYVTIYLKNGNTMRVKSYEKTAEGVRLILDNGEFLIKEDLIARLP
ncbi:MAG: lytic transglycosylase domain-containing protein [Candidatus Lindowbacteria bacterium]|nr:lytic transglycosylase domain-containing protein [Candidatus Lindowbacteria bacterium]